MRFIIFLLAFLVFGMARAQQEDSLESHGLDAVTVTKPVGKTSNLQAPESNLFSQEIWKSKTSFQINQYGLGGLSTLAAKGGNSEQVSVLWQGLPINSVANGSMDANLIPIDMFSGIQWNTPNGAVSGSGSISGTFSLIDPVHHQLPLWTISSVLGTTGRKSILAQLATKKGRTNHRTSVFLLHSNNAFSSGAQNVNVLAHPTNLHAVLHESILRKKNTTWSWNLWLQNANRMLPNGTLEPVAQQNDQTARTAVEVKGNLGAGAYVLKTAFFVDLLNYENKKIKEQNAYSGHSWFQIAEYKKQIGKGTLSAIGEWRHQTYQGDTFYQEKRNEFNIGAHYKYRPSIKNWKGNAALRTVYTPNFNNNLPVLFAIDATKLDDNGHWTLSASENYRLPTFNQLFWRPGGDASLQPEKSFHINLERAHDIGSHVQIEIDAYSIWYRNRLIWIPGFSYPKVNQETETQWSKGVDVTIQSKISIARNTFLAKSQVSYNRTNTQNQRNRQAIFFPIWRFQQRLELQKELWNMGINFHHQGIRYTDNENKNVLPAVNLLDVFAQYQFRKHLNIQLGVNNVLNAYYYFIPNQPMPGINANIKVTKYIIK